MTPIGRIEGGRSEPDDDNWGEVESTIVVDRSQFSLDALAGIEDFSHLDVVFVFDRVDPRTIHVGARHPRRRTDWPRVGIFAQRAKARPNRIGVSTCELIAVDGFRLRVRGLDAIADTPILDIKPHIVEFEPRTPTRQPAWISEVVADYW